MDLLSNTNVDDLRAINAVLPPAERIDVEAFRDTTTELQSRGEHDLRKWIGRRMTDFEHGFHDANEFIRQLFTLLPEAVKLFHDF